MWKIEQILSTCLFRQKNEKNISIINNDGEHVRQIENGVSSLQLLSCNHADGIRIALIQNTCWAVY